MTFTHALATNNYGPAKFIVTASAANGTHTTIASALTAATSGDTIFIRNGTYTENLTLKAGVNLTAWEPDGFEANVNIVGNCTHNTAGFVMCSGIRFTTNGAAAITVSGSADSKLRLIQCYINSADSTAIIYSSSSVNSSIQVINCEGNTGTTGVGIFTHTAAGQLSFSYSFFTNTGGSSTASNTTGGVVVNYTTFLQPLSTSSAGSYNFSYSNINSSTQNVTAFTTAGTGTSFIEYSDFVSGTASAISVGSGTTVSVIGPCTINSSNTNAVTGAGTLIYGRLQFSGSSSLINTTTQTAQQVSNGIDSSTLQPAFLATHSVAQNNVTGNGATATVNFTTEIFDQNSNYDGTNTFTAPITGRYIFNAKLFINDMTTTATGYILLATSNRNYIGQQQLALTVAAAGQLDILVATLADMDAGDTCIVQANVSGMAGNTADYPASVTNTYFSGYLVC